MAENPSNIVPDQIILLEGGSKLVPAPSSSDSGKVLAVLNTNGDIGWAEGQGGTVDQTYDASSTNAQSGTAVAEAVGTPVNLVQGSGITLTESGGNVTISADAQLPASTSADATKVLTVDATGAPGWATVQGGGTPVVQRIATSFHDSASILAELPQGEYLEPGRYQLFFKFGVSEYASDLRFIRFGYQVDHADYITQGSTYDPVNIDSNGPFGNNANFLRTGYVDVFVEGELSGFYITFSNGNATVQGLSNLLNNISLSYLKVADLS